MSIAITEEHVALATTARDLLASRKALEAARATLTADAEERPPFWAEVANIGWLGLHLAEEHGGSGYGIEELVVVVEELGRVCAPGLFVPTVIASAVICAVADDATKARLLPGLADGTLTGAVAANSTVTVSGTTVSGSAGVVIGGGIADVMVLGVGDDLVIVETREGVSAETPKNLDLARRSSRVTLDNVAATVVVGGRDALIDLARLLFSAEAVGMARECTEQAAEYAKVRHQFGRPIAMFQAVKHHCANMLVATELATSAVWDAARAASLGDDQRKYACAMAATLAAPAADLCANLDTQVQGGIAMTWEHDAHLYMRRATVLLGVLEPERAAADLTDLTRRGVVRTKAVDLPAEAEEIGRASCRERV